MKSPEAMVAYLAEGIGLLYYHRPLMYGGTGAGVETLLVTLHDAWAFLTDYEGDWRDVRREAFVRAGNNLAAGFSTFFSINHPDASQEEVAAYVVEHWKPVSEELGVPIPHAALKAEFEEFQREIERCKERFPDL